MSAALAAKLYTPDVLSLATELAAYPLSDEFPYRAEARSRTCGSTLGIGLALDGLGAISTLGMQVSACAVGQAAAAIFARSAKGRDAVQVRVSRDALTRWLGGKGDLPDWPGLAVLEPAREHTARHSAIGLPWNAAIEALSKAASSG